MAKEYTLGEVLSISIGAEGEARDFYLGLSRMFPEPDDICAFWRDMMQDEELHLRELKAIRDSLSPDTLKTPVREEYIEKISTFLKFNAEENLRGIKTLDDAYKTAVNLEFSEVNKVMELIVSEHIPHDSHREETIASLEGHLEKIRGFPKKFGDSTVRRALSATDIQ